MVVEVIFQGRRRFELFYWQFYAPPRKVRTSISGTCKYSLIGCSYQGFLRQSIYKTNYVIICCC